MPSGNVIGSYWRDSYGNKNSEDQAQAGVREVVRETNEIAWELLIYGRPCPSTTCASSYNSARDQGTAGGWVMYRFVRA